MLKKIPTGIQDYHKLRGNDYFTIDKSLLIEDFLKYGTEVTLITRPRRFGKTLNMSMMAEFFDITKDSKPLFEGLAIMNSEYVSEMNQYPTIFISFAQAKDDIKSAVASIKLEITNEYERYAFVLDTIGEFEEPTYNKIRNSLSNLDDHDLVGVSQGLSFLMKKLKAHYGKKTMLFIDEYDTPFIEAHIYGYYKEIRSGLSQLMQATLKGNPYLQQAMITGIQRVAKENVFSGLNNLEVFTVEKKLYSQYFGFTEEETRKILEAYGLVLDEQVKQMYDGYQYGGHEIYNPWSIINYAKSHDLDAYWVDTSSNTMIKSAMGQVTEKFNKDYETLIKTGSVTTIVNMGTSFYEQANSASLWGMLVNAGYLTIINKTVGEDSVYTLCIPNGEVRQEFKRLTMNYLNIDDSLFMNMMYSIRHKQKIEFIDNYKDFIMMTPSFYDIKNENSVHMLLLGMCAYLNSEYEISSNHERGKGRYDILLKARNKAVPNYVFELKYITRAAIKKDSSAFQKAAKQAIIQIQERLYDTGLVGNTIYVGLAHCGKEAEIAWLEQ